MTPSAPRVLAFDTSSTHCAAALMGEKGVLETRSEEMAKGQAERLMPMLEEMLQQAGLGWSDLDAIGVGIGPGNFTGVRISVSAARGLALSLGVPAVGVSTFEAMALGTGPEALPPGSTGGVVTSLDAKRDTLYVATFDASGQPPVHCTIDSLPPMNAEASPVCIGHRAGEIAERYHGRAAEPAFPLPVAIAMAARMRFQHSDLPRPAPLYIRPADAAPPKEAPPVLLP